MEGTQALPVLPGGGWLFTIHPKAPVEANWPLPTVAPKPPPCHVTHHVTHAESLPGLKGNASATNTSASPAPPPPCPPPAREGSYASRAELAAAQAEMARLAKSEQGGGGDFLSKCVADGAAGPNNQREILDMPRRTKWWWI